MRGDQDYGAAQSTSEVEATFAAEPDVDEHDIRSKLLLEEQRLGARRRNPDNRNAFTLEQQARGIEEALLVIDDEAANLLSSRRRTRLRPAAASAG